MPDYWDLRRSDGFDPWACLECGGKCVSTLHLQGMVTNMMCWDCGKHYNRSALHAANTKKELERLSFVTSRE